MENRVKENLGTEGVVAAAVVAEQTEIQSIRASKQASTGKYIQISILSANNCNQQAGRSEWSNNKAKIVNFQTHTLNGAPKRFQEIMHLQFIATTNFLN